VGECRGEGCVKSVKRATAASKAQKQNKTKSLATKILQEKPKQAVATAEKKKK